MCNHHRTIEDYGTGDIICLDCAHVIDQLLGSKPDSQHVNLPPFKEDFSFSKKKSKYHLFSLRLLLNEEGTDLGKKHLDFLKEIVSKLHASYSIAEESFDFAVSLLPTILQRNVCHTKIDIRPLLSFSLYETFKRRGNPQNLERICFLCEAKKSQVTEVESLFLHKTINSPLIDYVEPLCYKLGVSFYIMREVQEEISLLKRFSHYRPEVVIVASLLLIQEREKKKTNPSDIRFSKMSIKYICEMCNVARTSVDRLKKLLSK